MCRHFVLHTIGALVNVPGQLAERNLLVAVMIVCHSGNHV